MIDPMSEDYGYASPYNYTLNNPVNNTDPDGMSVDEPVGIRNDYNFGPDGKLDNVVIKPGPDHFYQTDRDGKTSELNGNQLTPEMSAQYVHASPLLPSQGGNQLNEIVIKGKKVKNSGVIAPYVPWSASMGEAGIEMSFPIEGLFPGLRAFSAVSSIFDLVNKPVLTKKSGKDKASDIPSWAAGQKPLPGESGKGFAKRLLDRQYGEGKWSNTGPGSEYNKLKKNGDRGR